MTNRRDEVSPGHGDEKVAAASSVRDSIVNEGNSGPLQTDLG